MYVLALLWLILFKFSFDLVSVSDYRTGLNVIPFAGYWQANFKEMFANFIVFIPFGLLLGVNFKGFRFWPKLAGIFVFSVSAEIAQFVWTIGTADITDVILNSSGGFLGLLLYGIGRQHIDILKRDRRIVATSLVVLLVLFGALFSGRIRFQAAPSATVIASQSSLIEHAQLTWPSSGQAAVGTVEEGLLARSSNNEKPRPTASMAKVITALAIMEKQPFKPGQTGKTYTLTSEDVAYYQAHAAKDGSVVPVYEGMVITQYQAMQMMLIASGNNIADTLVERVFGSAEAYDAYVQDMLERYGLHQTVVTDASGFDPATVSTPSELVAVGIIALKNPVIAQIVAQSHAYIPGVGTIKNTNELLGSDGVVGIKTGTTDEAGSCLLFAAEHITNNGQKITIVGVNMGDKNASKLFNDSAALLASVKQGFGLTQDPATNSAAPLLWSRNQGLRE